MGNARTGSSIEQLDSWYVRVCAGQWEMFRLIADVDRTEAWKESGARDMAQWLWMRYGISDWKARRWIHASHVIADLPHLSSAFERGALGIDKVVEVARFATPETDALLTEWARDVSPGRIRHVADVAVRRSEEEVREVDRTRFLSWWFFDEGRRFGFEAELPAAEGAVVARALERLTDSLPIMPDEHETHDRPARRADALVALASATVAADTDPDRATVVVHASLDSLSADDRGCALEGGGVVHAETARRLACSSRLQAMIEDDGGSVVGVGRVRREPPAWMLRQLRYRDHGCTFPGCGTRSFVEGHHIAWWTHGGKTDLDNLALVCSWHHKLVHEYGWSLVRRRDGTIRWYRPDGRRYRAGPSSAVEAEPESEIDAIQREFLESALLLVTHGDEDIDEAGPEPMTGGGDARPPDAA